MSKKKPKKYVRTFYGVIYNTETNVWKTSSSKVLYENPKLFNTTREKNFVADGDSIVDVIKVGDIIAEGNTKTFEVVDEEMLVYLHKYKNHMEVLEIWHRRDNTMSLIWSKERDEKLPKELGLDDE